MPRWIWWVPFGLLVVAGALVAFRLGFIDAHLTESDAIMHYAQRHARITGGAVGECLATPGRDTWLELRCSSNGRLYTYAINRFGGLQRETVQ
ncbi:hypothetical protein [Sagittula sp. SSi028]|uniref:hypothetical protein n=1 Tax=Sagittula sp. SSi028 TaxID=3400636 RepID=UPI003AF96DE8